jgi:hypothetical protein
MRTVDWSKVFEESHPRAGASDAEIAKFVHEVGQPLSRKELKELRRVRRDCEPERWIIPNCRLPAAYLNFLKWSNGGEFRNGRRLIQFFPISEDGDGGSVRWMMLHYGVPFYTPGILPFALNGGGDFYAFDMRFRAVNGEYSIVSAECCWRHTPRFVATTFKKACTGRRPISELWDSDWIDKPMCPKCAELLSCPKCTRRGNAARE